MVVPRPAWGHRRAGAPRDGEHLEGGRPWPPSSTGQPGASTPWRRAPGGSPSRDRCRPPHPASSSGQVLAQEPRTSSTSASCPPPRPNSTSGPPGERRHRDRRTRGRGPSRRRPTLCPPEVELHVVLEHEAIAPWTCSSIRPPPGQPPRRGKRHRCEVARPGRIALGRPGGLALSRVAPSRAVAASARRCATAWKEPMARRRPGASLHSRPPARGRGDRARPGRWRSGPSTRRAPSRTSAGPPPRRRWRAVGVEADIGEREGGEVVHRRARVGQPTSATHLSSSTSTASATMAAGTPRAVPEPGGRGQRSGSDGRGHVGDHGAARPAAREDVPTPAPRRVARSRDGVRVLGDEREVEEARTRAARPKR